MARSKYGTVIVVRTRADMGGSWGLNTRWREPVYRNIAITDGPGSRAEVPGITIAAEIELEEFAECERPEMDWGAIPPNDVYRFIVLHEIGHRLHNFSPFELLSRGHLEQWCGRLSRVNEALADRFAWNELYPGSSLPKRAKSAGAAAEIERDVAALKRLAPLGGVRIEPLPQAPGLFVPCNSQLALEWLAESTSDEPTYLTSPGPLEARRDRRAPPSRAEQRAQLRAPRPGEDPKRATTR